MPGDGYPGQPAGQAGPPGQEYPAQPGQWPGWVPQGYQAQGYSPQGYAPQGPGYGPDYNGYVPNGYQGPAYQGHAYQGPAQPAAPGYGYQGQPGYPAQADYPGQPGNPAQAGYPGQVQAGGYPGQLPGGYPAQFPGGYPGQLPGGYPGQLPGGYPAAQPGTYTFPAPAKGRNTFATASLFTWIVPIAGLAFGIAGFAKSRRDGVGRVQSLIGIALSVVVAAGVIVLVPNLIKATDPGCQSFKGTALPAYNQTISDLNAQASQTTLTSDITTAINDISTAAGQAKSAAARTTLDALAAQLATVRSDVAKGSVPLNTVDALNNAASSTDSACGTI